MKILYATVISCLLVACASTPIEEFEGSFFSYKDKQGKQYFSQILTLINASRDHGLATGGMPNASSRRGEGRGTKGARSQGSRGTVPKPQNPEDAKVSLSFRMEEQAFALLESNLAEKQLCDTGYEIEESKFERARYKIKGYCSVN